MQFYQIIQNCSNHCNFYQQWPFQLKVYYLLTKRGHFIALTIFLCGDRLQINSVAHVLKNKELRPRKAFNLGTKTLLQYSSSFLLGQEAKLKEMKVIEKMRVERAGEEAALAVTMHNTKKKLLNDLAEDEAKREADVKKLQQLRDEEKKTLFTSLSSGN